MQFRQIFFVFFSKRRNKGQSASHILLGALLLQRFYGIQLLDGAVKFDGQISLTGDQMHIAIIGLAFAELLVLTAWDYYYPTQLVITTVLFAALAVATMISARKGAEKWVL